MKTRIILLMGLLPLLNMAQNGPKNFIDQPYVELTGKAEMEVVPNEIFLKIIIDEKDSKGKKKLEELEKQMIKELKKLGIDTSKDLLIKDFASNFKNFWLRKTRIYTSKIYQLLVHNGKTAGLVFNRLESIGISNISVDRIDHSDLQKLKTELIVKALKSAKNKATALAEAINQTIGKAIYIREINTYHRPMPNMFTKTAVNGMVYAKDVSPELDFEKIELESSVTVRFELR